MAGIPMYYHRNYNSSDNETYTSALGYTILSIQDLGWTAEEGYSFKEWNTRSDGLGASREIGETIVDDNLYAIWEINYDVTISYKGSIIAGMSSSGTKTLETEGKYCEDDITVTYTKTAGGGGVEVDTCTINISTMQLSTIWATRIVDNKIVTSMVEPEYNNSYTIQDVVCGSYMRVRTTAYILTGFSSINGSSHVFENNAHSEHMIQVTTASTDTIRLRDDD